VHPAEVERVLEAHPAIGEVAVVGVPDEEWGERVRAVVVVREGRTLTLEELRGWAKERLEAAKVPSELALVDALPRNPTGKILRQELHGDAPSPASRPR
jgi:fatty-acyl-CoA synthase